MAKDKKTKAAAAPVKEVDPRLIALVGSFLKDAGLTSTTKIFKAETESKKLKADSATPAPASLEEALKAWESAREKDQEEKEEEEDSGDESDSESSDSSDSDSSDSDSSDEESEDEKSESSATMSADEKAPAKEEKPKKKEEKPKKKAEKKEKEESSDRYSQPP
jgi:hypothetical protein